MIGGIIALYSIGRCSGPTTSRRPLPPFDFSGLDHHVAHERLQHRSRPPHVREKNLSELSESQQNMLLFDAGDRRPKDRPANGPSSSMARADKRLVSRLLRSPGPHQAVPGTPAFPPAWRFSYRRRGFSSSPAAWRLCCDLAEPSIDGYA
jgi:hypothetical protein